MDGLQEGLKENERCFRREDNDADRVLGEGRGAWERGGGGRDER